MLPIAFFRHPQIDAAQIFFKIFSLLSCLISGFSNAEEAAAARTSSAATATRHAIGLPPYVEPCCPGLMVSMISSVASTAETGTTPPDNALPSTRMSGLTLPECVAS